MGNCLVTKLKEAVDNPNLDKLGYLRFTSPAVAANSKVATIISHGDNMDLEIISGNGTFEVGGVDKGAHWQGRGNFNIVHTDTNPVIFTCNGLTGIYQIKNCFTDLEKLFIYNNSISYIDCDAAYSNLTGLTKLTDLSKIPSSLGRLQLYRSAIGYLRRGTVSDLAKCTNLLQVIIESDQSHGANSVITGPISDFAPCTSLGVITLVNQALSGTVESLGNAMAPNRSSGQIIIRVMGSDVTYNSEPVPYTLYLQFGSSMTDPTAEETARGWKVV